MLFLGIDGINFILSLPVWDILIPFEDMKPTRLIVDPQLATSVSCPGSNGIRIPNMDKDRMKFIPLMPKNLYWDDILFIIATNSPVSYIRKEENGAI